MHPVLLWSCAYIYVLDLGMSICLPDSDMIWYCTDRSCFRQSPCNHFCFYFKCVSGNVKEIEYLQD